MDDASTIIDELQREPFVHFSTTNNCVGKALRLRNKCRDMGIHVRVVISVGVIGNVRYKYLPPYLPLIHGWAEIAGCRIELARPLKEVNALGTYDVDIKPFIAIWI